MRITHVFETHLHNDYVTGGLALARATGAAYHVNAADQVAYERVPVRDGDVVEVSPSLRVHRHRDAGAHLHPPVLRARRADGEPVGVFSGGSLLFGSTGRPDLLGPDHTHDLVHHQYASAHRLADELPDARPGAAHPRVRQLLLGDPVRGDVLDDRAGEAQQPGPDPGRAGTWVEELLAGLDAYPAYYAHMGPANAAGPAAPDLSAARTGGQGSAAGPARGRGVAGRPAHPRPRSPPGTSPGTLNFGIDGQFATYLGWLIPWGTPLTLLGDTPGAGRRGAARAGPDRHRPPRGRGHRHPARSGPTSRWAGSSGPRSPTWPRSATTAPWPSWTCAAPPSSPTSHLDGAVNIPLHELLARLDEVPAGEVWVHCAGGYRASIAASILAAHGSRVVAVDDCYDEHAAAAGLPMAESVEAGG